MIKQRQFDVLEACSFPGLTVEVFHIWEAMAAGSKVERRRFYLRVCAQEGSPYAISSVDGTSLPWKGRHWRLSEHMTDGELVQTAFKAIMTALEHEARERFTYKGKAIFGPHLDVDKLVEIAGDTVERT